MKKLDLMRRVSDLCGFTLKDTQLCFDMAIDLVKIDAIQNGKTSIAGLGSFIVVDKAPRKCSDPRDPTKTINVPAKKAIRFKASSQFKALLK